MYCVARREMRSGGEILNISAIGVQDDIKIVIRYGAEQEARASCSVVSGDGCTKQERGLVHLVFLLNDLCSIAFHARQFVFLCTFNSYQSGLVTGRQCDC